MTKAVLSPKFQIVIPKEVRRKLGLKPGQQLAVTEKDGRIELTPVLTPAQIVGFLKSDKPLVFQREPDREL
jgi:AbrB family looped-hinge helix DNA binding protein